MACGYQSFPYFIRIITRCFGQPAAQQHQSQSQSHQRERMNANNRRSGLGRRARTTLNTMR